MTKTLGHDVAAKCAQQAFQMQGKYESHTHEYEQNAGCR